LPQDAAVVVKLCDFGFSKDEDRNSGSKSGCGTPEYVAPEVRAAQRACTHGSQACAWRR
jgi:serine/threonine protein kinase